MLNPRKKCELVLEQLYATLPKNGSLYAGKPLPSAAIALLAHGKVIAHPRFEGSDLVGDYVGYRPPEDPTYIRIGEAEPRRAKSINFWGNIADVVFLTPEDEAFGVIATTWQDADADLRVWAGEEASSLPE